MKAVDIFGSSGKEVVRQAIKEAEALTSGEIRVFIDDNCNGDVLDRAAFVFAELGMHHTILRNGVLIYLSVKDHKFAIIGDAGIHAKVGSDFWNTVKEKMQQRFKEGNFIEGITVAVQDTGVKLGKFFPKEKGDINELPDDIIFGGEPQS